MSPGILIIRADATAAIGHGHVMRCLALAQAWQDRDGECVFAVSKPLPAIEKRLNAEGCEVFEVAAQPGSHEDAREIAELAEQKAAQWVLADGYHFGIEYQQVLKSAGLKLLLVDDYGQIAAHAADIVLDQNAGARQSFYESRGPGTPLLLGTRYTMLRREFRVWREWKREIPEVARKILVTMGGSDPENLTARVIQALEKLLGRDLAIIVVIGSGNQRRAELQELASRSKSGLRLQVDVANIPDLMAWADIAVSSASSTCWEMCLVGLPMIVTDAARNQQELACEIQSREIGIQIPAARFTPSVVARDLASLLADSRLRSHMSTRARALVDGRGSERVIAAMRAHDFTLRRVADGDCRLLWEWTNDSQVRRASFASATISWEEHRRWFNRKINDDQCRWLIFSNQEAAAVVRIEMTSATDAEIGMTVASKFRSQGLAPYFLQRAVQQVFTTSSLDRLHARIKPDNPASLAAFEGSGFVLVGTTVVRDQGALHYIFEREGCRADATVHQCPVAAEAV